MLCIRHCGPSDRAEGDVSTAENIFFIWKTDSARCWGRGTGCAPKAAALTVRIEMLVAPADRSPQSQTGAVLKGRGVSSVSKSAAEPARARRRT